MLPRRRPVRWASVVVRMLALVALAGAMSACASASSRGRMDDRPLIAFENSAGEPVRVYLLELGGGYHLLGNVYPMERTMLRVPVHLNMADARDVALVAVPMSRHAPSVPITAEHMASPMLRSVDEIAAFRWVVTPGALHGQRFPMHRSSLR